MTPSTPDSDGAPAKPASGAPAQPGSGAPGPFAPIRLLSVNVGRAATLDVGGGRQVQSGIVKRAASTLDDPRRVPVRPLGLEGDEQVDLEVHGGLSKAVYAYPSEYYGFWQTVRAQAQAQAWGDTLPPGFMGENLTVAGLLESQAYIGDLLRFPDCDLAISEPRYPCFKFQAVMGFKHAVKMMGESGYCGFYLAVRNPGTLAAGEQATLVPGPREVSIQELFRAKMKSRARQDD